VPTLAETQLLLRDAIVRDDAGGLATLLGGPDSEKGLGIHRRNYETSLVTALLTKFPATVWLAGSTFLSQAAKRFAHEHPPLAPCIAEYGQDFPGFMASLAGAESVPYLADFSNLEWHVGRVSIEIDEPSLALEQFCAINPDILPEMALRLQPGLRYQEALWPVDELLKMFITGTAPQRYALGASTVWLEIQGARGEFQINRLDPWEFLFRKSISERRTLGAAAERALKENPAFDAGQGFIRLIQDGLATGVEQ